MEPSESFKMSRCKVKNYYNQHLRHRNHRQHNMMIQQQQRRTMFLPIMLCAKTSVKDVSTSSSHQIRRQNNSPSPYYSSSSPVNFVGCVYQAVKRNNKVVSVTANPSPIPPSAAAVVKSLKNGNNTTTDGGNGIGTTTEKTKKIRKFFFFKKTVTVTATTSPTSTLSCKEEIIPSASEIASRRPEYKNYYNNSDRKCRIRAKCVGNRAPCRFTTKKQPPIDISKLDPPLPVVKKQPPQLTGGVEGESLWKRRSGGAALRCLQVQPVHVAGGGGSGGGGVAAVEQSVEAKTV